MELRLQELRQEIPFTGSQYGDDPIVMAHFFLPDTNWDWYAIEFDGVEVFYGWSSRVGVQELNTFYLSELRILRGLQGLPVEQDTSFEPMPLSAVKKRHCAE